MFLSRRSSATVVGLLVVALTTAAGPLAAQVTPQAPCPAEGCITSVSVTPDGGTASHPVQTGPWTLDFAVRNTGNVTTPYALTCSATGVTCGTVTPASASLAPGQSIEVSVTYSIKSVGGRVTLTANNFGGSATNTGFYTITATVLGVATTPDAGTAPARLTATGPYTETFTVRNSGTGTTTYTVTCAGSPNLTCSGTTASSVTLAAGASTTVGAIYSVGAVGTGTLTLTAAAGTVSDPGSYTVSVVASSPQAPVVAIAPVNPGATVERSLCLTVALGEAAASECGDLRIVHTLSTTKTLNKARTPTLLYNSQLAHPQPMVAALVTLPVVGTVPDSVTAKVTIAGVEKAKGKWAGPEWSPGKTRRITLSYDALGEATNVYSYTLEVRNWYGTTPTSPATTTGQLAIVNRSASPFGAGWWLAGLERLEVATMLWTGGDGSVRQYSPAGTDVWTAPSVDHSDVLRKDASGNFTRYDKDSLSVTFDPVGRHIRTRNRQGHVTSFGYDANGRLSTITLPPAAAGRVYRFDYPTGQVRVTAPPPSPTISRVTTLALSSGRVTQIQDPDTTVVGFTYAGAGRRIVSRVDRLGVATTFEYDAGWRVKSGKLIMPAPVAPLTTLLIPAESRGLAGTPSLDTAKAYTHINGRRTDVADTTAVWLDRFGAPRKIADALGNVTALERGDTRWPGLVTKVTYPNGFAIAAVYDTRGNLTTSTELNPLGDGRNATTQYTWDTKWDAVTKVTRPELDHVDFFYDPATGNRLWQRDGRGVSTQVSFGYNSANQLQSITKPGATAAELIGYDGLGNVNLVTTPLGNKTRITNDDAGRTIKHETQVNAAATLWRVANLGYDLQDRQIREDVIGPALNGVSQQTATVRTLYNAGGQVDTILRTVSPDPAGLGLMRTTFAYDAAGRPVAEYAPDHSSTQPRVDSLFYDAAGNPLRSLNRLGQSVRSTYDALNRLKIRRTEAVHYDYRYDGLAADRGQLLTACEETRPASIKPEICKLYPRLPNDGAQGYLIKPDTAVFDYDEMGRLIQADNRSARIQRQYLRGGALLRDSLYIRTWAPLDSGGTFTSHKYGLQLSYDLNGRRRTLTHPLQFGHLLGDATGTTTSVESYTYDPGHAQLASVTNPMNVSWTLQLNVRGELANISALQGQALETFGYDSDGNLVSDIVKDGAALDRQATITYDPRGLMTRLRNTKGAADTVNFYYSGLGHLLADSLTAHGLNPFNDPIRYRGYETYGVDPLGNRRSIDSYADVTLQGGPVQPLGPHVKRNMAYQSKTGRHTQGFDPSIPNQRDSTSYDAAGNIAFVTQLPNTQEDRASYYAGSGQLVASEWREALSPSAGSIDGRWVFEEYRYDALGRRVVVMAQRGCRGLQPPWDTECSLSWIRRTVWDGDQELWEVQMPLTMQENDVTPVQLPNGSMQKNPFYGLVGYTNGLAIDRPFGFLRVHYASDIGGTGGYKLWQPFTLLPFYDVKGHPENAFISDASITRCPDDIGVTYHCVRLDWPFEWKAYRGYTQIRRSWHGSMLEDKRDASRTMYRRNRYYDPATGRFTQEDPIGLAGGINLYGFANGDPVNLRDPFGLCPVCIVGAAWALYEVGSAAYDVYQAYRTVGDPGASDLEKGAMVAAATYSVFGLGGGATLVIGKVDELRHLRAEERVLDLPNMGTPKANWRQNAGELREAMRAGKPIRDAHVDPRTGALVGDRKANGSGSFLTMERNLLRDRGWTYDPGTQHWNPPQR